MTIIYIILGVLAAGGGLVAFIIAAERKQATDKLLREQAEETARIEQERVHSDEEIRGTSDDELTARLNKWVQPHKP